MIENIMRTLFVNLLLLVVCIGMAHATTFQDINEAFGIPLMNSDNLWDEDAATVAARLGWPKESETPRDSSYRLYASASAQVLGVRPYSLVLYGEGGKVASLSLVFINKGDADMEPRVEGQVTQSKLDIARKKVQKDFEERIKADAAIIEERLAKAFNKQGDKTTPRATRTMREQVKRWDWNNHTFLLSAQAGEYVRLQMLPTDVFLDRREPSRPMSCVNSLPSVSCVATMAMSSSRPSRWLTKVRKATAFPLRGNAFCATRASPSTCTCSPWRRKRAWVVARALRP